MTMTKLFAAGLAFASAALAQQSCKGTATIQNSGDATALGSCSVYQGDVVIASQAAGSIALDGVRRITGSLTVDGAVNLTSLSGSDLEEIDKNFELQGLTILSSLNFPSLTAVANINWVALPALQQLSFTNGINMADSVVISNTELNTLDGINLQTCGTFNVNNNLNLKNIEMQMANVTESLNINANGKDLQASFPNLEWAFNMTFRNCSDVSLPSLSFVNGSLGFYSNSFESFVGANLTTTGQSLVFDDNSALTNISLPKLTTINGGYQIANNTNLKTINGFKQLKSVGGAIDFSGEFSNVSLPALSTVKGGFNLQTKAEFDCSAFDKDHDDGVIQGTYVCAGAQKNPGTAGTKPSGTSSGSSSSSTSSSSGHSAAGRGFELNFPIVAVIASFAAGFLHLTL